MELHHLRSFVTAVELGSFNAAAHALSYTGPAISQHVGALEAELGVELLQRHARGVSPTPAGVVLDRRARYLLDVADGVAHQVRAAALTPSRVRIGAFSTAAQFLLPPVLSSLLRSNPELELVLIDREPPEGFGDVLAGRLDLTVTHVYPGNELPDDTGLRVEPLLDDELLLLVPAAHWAVDGVRLSELARERWISGPPDAQNHIALERIAADVGFVPEVAFETTDYAVTTTLVANGLGPAFVPRLILSSIPDGVRLVALADEFSFSRSISLVTRDAEPSDAVGLVVDRLRTQVAQAA